MLGVESLLYAVDELVVLEEPESVETLSLLQAVRPTSIDNMITVDISFRFIENLTKQIIDVRIDVLVTDANELFTAFKQERYTPLYCSKT